MSHICKFCQKEFKRDSTLLAHLCEPKRRYQQRNEQGVQIGFNAYLRFYETTQGSAKVKTYDDFCSSPFYIAFVRFGRWAVDIRAVNTARLVDWLLKNNHKLDHWTKESLYILWLQEYLRKESVQDAIERALKEMQEYADTDSKLQNNFNNYFRFGSPNRICQHIAHGRISAWIMYNCESGIEWLGQLNPEQLNIVMPYIEPDFWQKKFKDYVADAEWCKMILKEAGL